MITALVVALGLLLLAPPATEGQPAGTIPKVGLLGPGAPSATLTSVQREPFEKGLRELGWTPGVNVTLEYRYAGESAARLAEQAVELVRLGVDVVVARGPQAVRAVRQASATVPIVMATVDDAVALGFVASLARPGGSTTGIANRTWELDGKRLALLKEALPGLARVGILANPQKTRFPELGTALLGTAQSLGLRAQVFEVTRSADIATAFTAVARARVGALLVLTDIQVLEPNRARIVALAREHRLPAMYPWRFYAELGGLMSYSATLPDLHYRSAMYVDRILRGAKPSDLPVEEPTRFELVINVRTARALGVTNAPSVMLQADQLIE